MGIRSYRLALCVLLCLTIVLPAVPPQSAQAVSQNQQAIQIESSVTFTAALRADGTVWAWGVNNAYQLGESALVESSFNPYLVIDASPAKIVDIAVGSAFGAALDDEGNVWIWGTMDYSTVSERGFQEEFEFASPIVYEWEEHFDTPVTAIAAGNTFALALTEDKKVYAWGDNALGQGGAIYISPDPVPVLTGESTPLKDIVQIAAGDQIAIAKSEDGTVYQWSNHPDELYATPIFSGLSGQDSVFAGAYYAYATVGEAVYGWGRGTMLGFGNSNQYPPTLLPDLSNKNIIQIDASTSHALALSMDGTVYGIGNNSSKQMGHTFTSSDNFVIVPELYGATEVIAGREKTFFKRDGQFHGVGSNRYSYNNYVYYYGALGVGYDLYNIETPLPVMDPAENLYKPRVPTDVRVYEYTLDSFRVEYDIPPFSSSNRIFWEIYQMGDSDPVESEHTSMAGGYFMTYPLEPGTYYFKIYTCECNSSDDVHYSEEIIVDNGGKGYVVEDLRTPFRVKVVDNAGNPLESIQVHLYKWIGEGQELVSGGTTDPDGMLQFADVHPGWYFLSFATDGYEFHLELIYLVTDVTFEVHLPENPKFFTYLKYKPDDEAIPGQLKGSLLWDRILADQEITHYHVYWTGTNGNKRDDSEPPLLVELAGESNYWVDIETQVPEEASGLALFGYNEYIDAEFDTGARVTLVDDFSDQLNGWIADADPNPGVVQRTVTWDGLADESAVSHYIVYLVNHYDSFMKEYDLWKIAEIPANGQSSYSFEIPIREFGGIEETELMVSVRYAWGEHSTHGQIIQSVDYNHEQTTLYYNKVSDTLFPPIEIAFDNVSTDPQQIEGWIGWEIHPGTDTVSEYEIVFLDANRAYIRSIMRVFMPWYNVPHFAESYRAYLPLTPIPANAAYIGIYARDYDWISSEVSVFGLDPYGQDPGDGGPGENPTEGNRILETAFGILDDSQSAILYIPKKTMLGDMISESNLKLPDGAEIKGVLYNGMVLQPPHDLVPVSEGMQLMIEDGNGQHRFYTLRTLAAHLDGKHNGDGNVDLADLLLFLSSSPPDLTGDGSFTIDDILLLLDEIDPVTFLPAD